MLACHGGSSTATRSRSIPSRAGTSSSRVVTSQRDESAEDSNEEEQEGSEDEEQDLEDEEEQQDSEDEEEQQDFEDEEEQQNSEDSEEELEYDEIGMSQMGDAPEATQPS
jgi:hypothetical protein